MSTFFLSGKKIKTCQRIAHLSWFLPLLGGGSDGPRTGPNI